MHRDVIYQTDTFGQVLSRQETNTDAYGVAHPGAQRTFYYLNERVIGDSGNDRLDSDTDYAQQLASDRNATVPQWWTSGTPVVGNNSNFDVNYEAINPTTVEQTGSSYTAMDGDTLQSIALNMWGDASLWYLIAEANGLGADATLVAGQIVTIPDKVYNLHNTSATFRPYSPNDALGNTSPTQPQPPAPKNHGCGTLGDVLASIVSTAVAIIVGSLTNNWGFVLQGMAVAAAADAAHQAVEIAVGNQSKYSWSEVAAAGVAGGIEGKFKLTPSALAKGQTQIGLDPLLAASNAIKRSVIEQGANIAFKVQKKFDWTGLAVAGAEAYTAQGVANWADDKFSVRDGSGNVLQYGSQTAKGVVLTGTAQILAEAVTRTAITGQDLGKSLREELPGIVGSTIGNRVGEAMVARPQSASVGKKGTGNKPYLLGTKPYSGPDIVPLSVKPLPDTLLAESLGGDDGTHELRKTYSAGGDKDGAKGWSIDFVGRTPKGEYIYRSASQLVTVDGDVAYPEYQSAGDMTFVSGSPMVGFGSKAEAGHILYSLDYGGGNVSDWFTAGFNPSTEVTYMIPNGGGEVIVTPPTTNGIDRAGRGFAVGFVDKLRSDGKAFAGTIQDIRSDPLAVAQNMFNAAGNLAYRYGTFQGNIDGVKSDYADLVTGWQDFQTAHDRGMGIEWVANRAGASGVGLADAAVAGGGTALIDAAGESAFAQAFLRNEAGGGKPLFSLGKTELNPVAAEGTIPTIGGRLPINSRYAGQIHPSGIEFTEQGFPNFKPYSQAEVEMPNLTGRYSIDSSLANQAMGYPSTPKGYVWHHVEDGVTMQLIPETVHNSVRHTGGAAVIRNGGFD